MNILVINCGSSSVKAEVIDTDSGQHLFDMRLTRLGEPQAHIQWSTGEETACPESDPEAAMHFAMPLLYQKTKELNLKGIGHRVVHGGDRFSQPTLIDDEVCKAIDELSVLAPLHNPVNLQGIHIAQEYWPQLMHVAVFDTAFHATLPRRAKHYAIPQELAEKHGIRRYGFHGPSHNYVAHQAAKELGYPIRELRLITCHLGNGASVCAVEYGRSIETSMGMTPLEGLVMGTRSGDLDAGMLLQLMRAEGMDADAADKMLNRESGLKGLAGDNDMREIEKRAEEGDEKARLAIQVYAHRLRKYIGAYAAVMGGVDAIVFTGGIGENSAVIRERVAQRLEFLGAILYEDANRDLQSGSVGTISTMHSRCKLLVVPTDEQLEIARQTALILEEKISVKDTQPIIPVAVSARHVHLTQEVVEQLFGKGYQLTEYKPLSQPGQFAANERVSLLGPKNKIERVRILGPTRSKNQVEISRTDEFFLGIDAPVRASGHVDNTPGIKIEGPEGSVTLTEGVICAWRHIHMTPEDAERFGVEDKDIVEVHVSHNEERSLTFGNVLVRVSPKYKLEMHIDTDEANAAEIGRGAQGVLISTEQIGALVKRQRVQVR
ncbi:MAG: acetate/propionate family kinase [Bacteroidota bacterium]